MKLLWVTINVKNMEESIAFYSELLGLKMTKRFPAGPGVEIAFMGNGVNDETLVELLADSSSVIHGESVAVGFAVDSVAEMLDKIKAKRIPVHSGPVETPGSIFFTVKDPNGFSVQLFQPRLPQLQ